MFDLYTSVSIIHANLNSFCTALQENSIHCNISVQLVLQNSTCTGYAHEGEMNIIFLIGLLI